MTGLQTALWPLSAAYGLGARLRNAAYNHNIVLPKRLPGIVISVGNLTVGGTGKTPVVLWLSEALLARGKHVAVLTRGYRGFLQASSKTDLDTKTQTKTNAADEPTLLTNRISTNSDQSSRFTVGIGADRLARGRELATRGFDYFILDDGFQHRQLARDLDILLVDASNPFGGGRLLPSGRLREPRSSMRRADLIVITRSTHAPAVEAAILRDSTAPIFYSTMKLNSIRDAKTLAAVPIEEIRRSPIFAFCGIGNPHAFFQNLRDWGFTIAGTRSFADHHAYSREEVAQLQNDARRSGAASLLCTEKDSINLSGAASAEFPIYYCEISLDVTESEDFWDAARQILKSRHPEIDL